MAGIVGIQRGRQATGFSSHYSDRPRAGSAKQAGIAAPVHANGERPLPYDAGMEEGPP
jgi:hypothetical protein